MFKFLFIVLLVMFVLRRLLPWIMRWVVGEFVKEHAQRPGTGYNPNAQRSHAADGRVRVDYVPPKPKRQPRPDGYRGGEYVDFEEVK